MIITIERIMAIIDDIAIAIGRIGRPKGIAVRRGIGNILTHTGIEIVIVVQILPERLW